MDKYVLTLTTEQLLTVSKACEFYARMLMGQFRELSFEITMQNIKDPLATDRREAADKHLLMARNMLYPELFGWGHSYGVGHNEKADKAFLIHQVLRYTRAWHEHPEGGITVDFGPPYPAGGESVPDCRVLTDDSDAATWKRKAEAAVADLRSVIKKCDDGCKLCAHYFECQHENCPMHEEGIGATGKDGTEYPDFKWSCEDFDWGTCSMAENTPCNGCDFQNHWEWRGIQEVHNGSNTAENEH